VAKFVVTAERRLFLSKIILKESGRRQYTYSKGVANTLMPTKKMQPNTRVSKNKFTVQDIGKTGINTLNSIVHM
jgi:hypothetical protein